MALFSDDSTLQIVIRARDEASKTLERVQGQLGSLNTFMQRSVNASRTFALGIAGAGTALGAFGLSAVKAAANAEQTMIAFETMLGSAEKAKEFYASLVQFAAKTPFELKGLEQASKQLLAYGFAQEEVLPNLKALGDITAGVGTDKLPLLILAFGQVRAATKLTGAELRQFTEAGVPLLDELAKQLGVTAGQVQEMVSEGEIGFDKVQKALFAMTEEGGRFNNLMDKQSKSLGGMWSNLQDAWEQFLRGQGAQLIEWAKQFVAVLIDIVQNHLPVWIEKTKEIVHWFGENKVVLAAVAGVIIGALVPAVFAVIAAFAGFIAVLAPFAAAGGALFMLIEGIREGNIVLSALAAGILALFIPAVLAIASTIWTTVLPAIAAMVIAFAPFLIAGAVVAGVVAGVMYIIKHWNSLKATTMEVWSAIRDYVGGVIDWITTKIQSLVNAVNRVKSAMSSIGSFVGSAVGSVGRGLGFEHGGTVPGPRGMPVPIMAHGQETIIPAGHTQRGGGSITVNINNPTVRDDNDLVRMQQMIERVFRDLPVNNKLTHA